MKIIIDDKIPYIKGLLDEVAEVRYLPYGEISHEAIRDADALIVRTRTKCNEALLEGTNVRMIATATIGMDHIDEEYCQERGIAVRNAPGCNAGSVAQWVEAALRVWMEQMMIQDASCINLGIVGLGNVGKRVREMAERIGMQVTISDPPLGYMTTLDEIAERCRIVTFHTPLTMGGNYPTLGMAGSSFFDKMAKDGLVINAARGGIVDEEQEKDWLRRHQEAKCAVDCWTNEPDIDRELLEMAMAGTPHIAGYSADGKWNGTRMAVAAVNECLGVKGKMPEPLPGTKGTAYDIMYDSDLLKHNAAMFEWFRGNYRERRE